ncbi:sulfatase family protein [Spirosoma utsteinense]|uniref:Arylsulfatase A-like enzyme n=1 Tax=Spirosoma utsteinense TaxID=2585773 RepID=A0ABR6WC97_9BACT|nr:sulfatase [Spirosoma utsteinense]MBC3788727.1 arylsulfatase A-like enzyme [Spirosoma utsteinense]MBC3794154.1 arylsulfatase A-like enzyme [Spirosoma utsteinense]
MNKKIVFGSLLGVVVTAALLVTIPAYRPKPAVNPAAERPNIIFIITDDHTSQAISAYGSKLMKTPNIDRIASEGAILYNNVVTNSICGPSRATLLTGKFSHMNGYKFNERQFDVNQAVFPEELQKNGYQTAWIGKMHLGSLPHGFDYLNVLPGHGSYYNSDFIDSNNKTTRRPGYVTNVVTQLSTDWLSQRDTSKPFFLVVGHKATHREWLPDLPDLGSFDDVTFPLPPTFYDDYKGRVAAQKQDMTIDKTMILSNDLKVHADYESKAGQGSYSRFTPEQKAAFYDYYENKVSKEFDRKKLSGKALAEWKYQRYMKDYLATARSLDRNIGTLLAYLDKTGLAKNTVVIYTSDQGFYLGEHGWFDKRFIYEESLKTPFVIRYPGVIKPGTKVESLVSNIDWAPTVLNLTGTAIPKEIQGKSFLPLLTGQKTPWRQQAYYHYYEYPQPHHVAPHFGLRTSQYTLARFYGPDDFWELYDIRKDPQNLNNLYGKKGYEKVTVDLKQQLKEQIVQYKDEEALKLVQDKAQ